jgi:hypothetical protein
MSREGFSSAWAKLEKEKKGLDVIPLSGIAKLEECAMSDFKNRSLSPVYVALPKPESNPTFAM